MSRAREIEREQVVLTRLYERLDALRDQTRTRLTEVRARGASGTHQARSERDAFAAMYEDRLAALEAVEAGLCFGRLDRVVGDKLHIGRIGLTDEGHESLLVDWRAPAAEAFYRATPAEPLGVTRRRQLRTRGRTVLDVEDDVFDVGSLSDDDRETLGGGGALLAALTAHRTGRMRDIVATIQGEQDRVIRDDPAGALVVQGGPGTGKTAVALHRAAYLLYSSRESLSRSGVLVIGPGSTFLRYIEQVLPALGETGVVTSTLVGLVNGLGDVVRERDAVAAVKADLGMADVIARAVAAREVVPGQPVVVPFEDLELVLTPSDIGRARARARRARHRHNRARYGFAKQLLRLLVGRLAEIDPELASQRYSVRQIMQSDEFRDLVNRLWPKISATELVADLLTNPASLNYAGAHLTRAERALLLREAGAPWTDADVALVDEAWSLLGDPEEMLRVAAERRRLAADHAYAQQVIENTDTGSYISARTLAQRYSRGGGQLDVASRATGDADWEYGHVIVDEAQELSPMAWRMIARRCPNQSMTIVGDIAQASSSWAPRSWAEVLDEIAPHRWRLRELTVNYRTPSEVMALAADVLHAVDSTLEPPSSVRDAGVFPTAVASTAASLAADVAELAVTLSGRTTDGRIAVIAPDEYVDAVAAAVAEALPTTSARGPGGLDAEVAVLNIGEAKGLEFDDVLVVEPAAWIALGKRGLRDLYVAMTRPTKTMTIVHTGELPEVLAGVRSPHPSVSALEAS